MLSIRFSGIVSFIAPRPGQHDPFCKRAVLSRSPASSPAPHLQYLEIEAKDLSSANFAHEAPFRRDSNEYIKFLLDGDEVIIDPIDGSLAFFEVDNFRELIPSVSQLAPGSAPAPGAEVFNPTGAVVGGYFDMRAGLLLPGEREQIATRFVPPGDWPRQRNAFWAQLLVRLKPNGAPTVTLRSLVTGATRVIQLRLGTACITIGNQPLAEIEGNGHPNLDPRDHFALHFRLAAVDARLTGPVPGEVHTAVNGCIPIRYP